jgi:hypothetical protein
MISKGNFGALFILLRTIGIQEQWKLSPKLCTMAKYNGRERTIESYF